MPNLTFHFGDNNNYYYFISDQSHLLENTKIREYFSKKSKFHRKVRLRRPSSFEVRGKSLI